MYKCISASYYEFWRSTRESVLYKGHENGTRVNESEVITGSLFDPQPPYSQETITLQLPNADAVSYGLIVRDDEDNPSVISNVISVPSASLLAEASATTASSTASVSSTADNKSDNRLAIGLGVGLPLALIAIGVIVAVLVIKMKSAKVAAAGATAASA